MGRKKCKLTYVLEHFGLAWHCKSHWPATQENPAEPVVTQEGSGELEMLRS